MSLTVLITDDDPSVSELLAFQLKRFDCVVHQVNNGPKAQALASQVVLDIVFMDIMMPGQDGLVTCQNLRKQGYSGIITMISALPADTNIDRAIAAGADDYLQKPVSRDVLANYIGEVTRKFASAN